MYKQLKQKVETTTTWLLVLIYVQTSSYNIDYCSLAEYKKCYFDFI